jgi:hypothetical protein
MGITVAVLSQPMDVERALMQGEAGFGLQTPASPYSIRRRPYAGTCGLGRYIASKLAYREVGERSPYLSTSLPVMIALVAHVCVPILLAQSAFCLVC